MTENLSSPAPVSPEISRRTFAKYITLGGFAALAGGIWALRHHFHHGGSSARVIAQLGDIPVGGSSIFQYPTPNDPCILVRTGENAYVAYSRICTHKGCPVFYDSSQDALECPCHGGLYSITDGSVLQGPPPRPLPRILIEVRGRDIVATGVVVRPA
ncbi:MAG: ubiquinol-cytochrome c reductase iron-sulfur subunit [Candidatus Acidiferrales bacterium]